MDEPVLAHLILTPGSAVRASGWVEDPGSRDTTLWLASPARPDVPERLRGADVEVQFRASAEVSASRTNGAVIGTWDGRRIVGARWDGTRHEPPTLVPAPQGAQPLESVTEEEFQAVNFELDRLFGEDIATSGGSREQDYIHVRDVTVALAEWYEQLRGGRYPLDVYVSMIPSG